MNHDTGVFEEVVEFPDNNARRRFAALVGLDHMKQRLLKESTLLVDHSQLERWCVAQHKSRLPILDTFFDRAPLFVFSGDVGTGKTALAETFGDPLARQLDLPVTLYALSLNARGTGAVGEMTSLISAAFTEVKQAAAKARAANGRPKGVYVLLIDEADALAQSRELAQMHHEDRAGVNAIIRGVDDLANSRLPVVIVMCTNRLSAIDPAVRRRAADVFTFDRPDSDRRKQLLDSALSGTGLTTSEIDFVVAATGDRDKLGYGFTFSDLTQRLLPSIVLDAFPDHAITFDRIKKIVGNMRPTPPFKERDSNE